MTAPTQQTITQIAMATLNSVCYVSALTAEGDVWINSGIATSGDTSWKRLPPIYTAVATYVVPTSDGTTKLPDTSDLGYTVTT